jgi:hypothetical protein
MTHTRADVLEAANAMFGEDNLTAVLVALDEYGTESYELEVNRVKVAILKLSGGKMDTLLYWVKIAKVDYRDPLAAQALGPLSPDEGAKLQAVAKNLIDRCGKK